MTQYYYHFTAPDNFVSIKETGLAENSFLCNSLEDCFTFINLYAHLYTDVFVLKVDASGLDDDKLLESYDHNKDLLKADAFIYLDNIDPSLIELHEAYKIESSERDER